MAYKLALESFDSINAMVMYGNTRKNNKAFGGRSRHSDTGDESFTGTRSYEEAEELLKRGWDEPLADIKKAMSVRNVKSNTQADRRKPTTGVVGYVPCVPNAILGLPNSMISSETVKQKVKAITLIYSVSVNCGWSTKDIVRCGTTVLKIVNMLELQGIRVKLVIENIAARKGSDLVVARVNVKDWREHIDLKKLAFPIVHPSMLRRIGFRWLETCPKVTNSSFTSGYGEPISNDTYDKVVRDLKECGALGKNEYYLNPRLCRDKKQDIDEILKEAGMTGLKIKEGKGA